MHSLHLGFSLALILALLPAGCAGRSGAASSDTTAAKAKPVTWTRDQLAKFDGRLKKALRDRNEALVAVKVTFKLAVPPDEELQDAGLVRVGGSVVGELGPTALREVADRNDVEKVEALSDAGYEYWQGR